MRSRWLPRRGAARRLHDPRPAGFADYRAIGGNILLLLGDDLEPLVGNEVHSYTLSRAPLPRWARAPA